MPVSSRRKKTKKRASHLNAHPNDVEARLQPHQVTKAIADRKVLAEMIANGTIVED